MSRYINQDAFTWAGELRQVDMYKDGGRPSFVHWRNIESEAKKITDRYSSAQHFEGLGKVAIGFVSSLAEKALEENAAGIPIDLKAIRKKFCANDGSERQHI